MSAVVLGLAVYPINNVWKSVKYLVKSTNKNSPHSSIVLITAKLGHQDRELLVNNGVVVFELADLPPSNISRATQEGNELFLTWLKSMWVKRHDYYLEVLKSLNNSHVLLTDTRDVIITGDISKKIDVTNLVLSQEDNLRSLKSEPHNNKWLLDGYGSDLLNSIGNKRILCAGTVFGPRALILSYVEKMMAEINRLGFELANNIGDQPIHNFLAHMGHFPDFEVSTAERGWIKSVGILDKINNDWFNIKNMDSNENSTIVLHQYDRHLHSRFVRSSVKKSVGLNFWQKL